MKRLLFILLAVSATSLFFVSCANNAETADAKTTTNENAKVVPTKATATPKAQKAAVKTAEGEAIKWVTIDEAQKLMAKNPKKIFMDVYTPWCGPCKMLDRMTFNQPEVIEEVNKNYYAVKFNAESQDPLTFNGKQYSNPNFDPNRSARSRNYPHQFTQTLSIRGYPALIVFDEKLNIIKKELGFKDKNKMMALLNSIK